jgi:hypothetical protein
VDASDYPGNPLNVFCDDFAPTDTFNLAIERGLVAVSHDSDSDQSTARITEALRAAITKDPTP